MAIDARISAVTREPDGSVQLHLEKRDKYASAGQPLLTVVNPVQFIESLVGECIWGSGETIMLGDVKLADRISYCTIRLVESGKDIILSKGVAKIVQDVKEETERETGVSFEAVVKRFGG